MSTNMAAVHARLDHQIATAPLRERVQRRGPLREDKLTHPAPVNELEASLRGHGDEIRRLIRRVEAIERRLDRIEKGAVMEYDKLARELLRLGDGWWDEREAK